MRKMFVENLPKNKYGSGHQINWKKSIGYNVNFEYDGVKGELPILDIVQEGGKGNWFVVTEYKNCKNFKINTGKFMRCCIGNLIGMYTKQYKFNVGDILELKSGKLKILEQIRLKQGNGTQKGYKYECLICANVDTIGEGKITSNQGCNVCCKPPQKILKGYNDLWSTHTNIAKMLKFPEIGYEISHGSTKKQIFICPDCGYEKNISPNTLFMQGFSCSKCGDGVSYSEKFVFNMLNQLNIDFLTQLSKKTFKWCENYKYDFYIPSVNVICETHGKQHYEQTGFKMTLQETQENDMVKKELALQNGIKEEDYIVIDCRKSELEFIKNNILNSMLNELFDLSTIDWLKCHEFACSSLVKEACKLWMNNFKDIREIGNVLKLSYTPTQQYLRKGAELGWCDYNPEEEISKVRLRNIEYLSKKVVCINSDSIFNSIAEASKLLNVDNSAISACCLGNSISVGKDANTGEKLLWMFYEDYIQKPKEELKEMLKNIKNEKVICLNTNEIFKSALDASKKYNARSLNITMCCDGILKMSGIHPITGKSLVWMYYDEYIDENIPNYELEVTKGKSGRKVVCTNSGEIFNTITSVKLKYNVEPNNISSCCKGKYKYAGKHPITNEPLHWQYYEDYIKQC